MYRFLCLNRSMMVISSTEISRCKWRRLNGMRTWANCGEDSTSVTFTLSFFHLFFIPSRKIFNCSSSPFRRPSVNSKFKRAPSRSSNLLAELKAVSFSRSFLVLHSKCRTFRTLDFTKPMLRAFFRTCAPQVANDSTRLSQSFSMQMSYN